MKQIETYITSLELGGKSAHTIRGYKKDILKLKEFFHIEDASELDNLTQDDYQNFYKSQNLSENSLLALVRNLSAFFEWLRTGKHISKDNEFFNVRFGKSRFPKEVIKKKIVLTEEEVAMLLGAASNKQEKLMIKILVTTAIRRDTLCNIKMSDINGCSINLGKVKGGDLTRETYLNNEICQMLQDYVMTERNTDSEYLFYGTRGETSENGALTGSSITNRVKVCALRSGISPERASLITSHRLRGTAITNMAKQRGKYAAQSLAFHKSGSTTERYIDTGNEFVRELLLGKQ